MDPLLPNDIIFEICLYSLDVYRGVIYNRSFHEYMRPRLTILTRRHTDYVVNCYRLCGRLHRDDGPAIVRSYLCDPVPPKIERNSRVDYVGLFNIDEINFKSQTSYREEWYQYNMLHRDSPSKDDPVLPATTIYYLYKMIEQGYDSPVSYIRIWMKWYRRGVLHRDDGPAYEYRKFCRTSPSGLILEYATILHWYKQGQIHSSKGSVTVYAEGNTYKCFDGVLHSDDGPAVILADGTAQWYSRGRRQQ